MRPLTWLAVTAIALNLVLVGIVAVELHQTNKKLDSVDTQLTSLDTKVDALPSALVLELGGKLLPLLGDLSTLRCKLGLTSCPSDSPGLPVYTVPAPR